MGIEYYLNNQRDLIVSVDEKKDNFGHNSLVGFPMMIWFSNKQLGKGNLFEGFEKKDLGEFSFEDSWHKEFFEDAKDFAMKLPMSFKEFNQDPLLYSFSNFSNGLNKIPYRAELAEEGKINYYKDEDYKNENSTETEIFSIDSKDFGDAINKYMNFIEQLEKEGSSFKEIHYYINHFSQEF